MGSRRACASSSRRSGAGSARSCTSSSPTPALARRASRSPARKASGASPATAKVASRRISKPEAQTRRQLSRAASMTSDKLKQLIRIWAGRRRCHSGRERQRRQSSPRQPADSALSTRSCRFCTASAASGRFTTAEQMVFVEAAQHQDHDLKSNAATYPTTTTTRSARPASRPVG